MLRLSDGERTFSSLGRPIQRCYCDDGYQVNALQEPFSVVVVRVAVCLPGDLVSSRLCTDAKAIISTFFQWRYISAGTKYSILLNKWGDGLTNQRGEIPLICQWSVDRGLSKSVGRDIRHISFCMPRSVVEGVMRNDASSGDTSESRRVVNAGKEMEADGTVIMAELPESAAAVVDNEGIMTV
jgi:hypothetical protein